MTKLLPLLFAIGLCAYVLWYCREPLLYIYTPFVDTFDYLMDALGGKLTK